MLKRYFLICTITLLSVQAFSQGSTAKKETPPPSDSAKIINDIFTKVDIEAEFPGGLEGWKVFLLKNLNVNVPIKNKAPVGKYKVMAKFLVGKDGSLSNISVENNPGYGTAEEVIRVLKKSPKWIPSNQNGRAVMSWRRQPITFIVD